MELEPFKKILTAIGGMIAAGAFGRVGENTIDGVFSKVKEFLTKTKNKSHNSFSSETGIDYSELEHLLKQAYATNNEDY